MAHLNCTLSVTVLSFVTAILGKSSKRHDLRKCVKNVQSGFQKIKNFEKIRDMPSRIQDQ